ncbi:SLC13 family permease [Acuticoccus sp. I52.16.1]|uniref:SLC13 family permease n=1 Tax=Acuticoccus sp. I52.16.1 TaxID=2928472 RepID=UPI001FD52DC6|nr:SLC13 family permease [Acuticoccus sp. I52.16.1]UOM33781.1 SLC13 family permease [Acuticoccus sp. I52.16.1]
MEADLAMVGTLLVIAVSTILYATERYSIEAISLGVLAAYIAMFAVIGLPAGHGEFNVGEILSGFANSGLITIVALLVVGQGLFHTDALERPAQILVRWVVKHGSIGICVTFVSIAALSAFLNNTPVVVMFIPIIATLASALKSTGSRFLMPLSFVTILGGMTTLIGSSTNLLAANVARDSGAVDLSFFSFTPIGLIIAGIGLPYVLGVMPLLLRENRTMAEAMRASGGKQFIAEIPIRAGHPLVGAESKQGMFPQLQDMTVRLVQRGERPHLPPFENVKLQPGDIVIVAATRPALERALSTKSAVMGKESGEDKPLGVVTLAEAIVAPGSRLIGRTVAQSGFRGEVGCVVLAIERRSRMPRMPMVDIRMEAGDVLLFAGPRKAIEELRGNRDVLLIDWTAADVPARRHAPAAIAVFLSVVLSAASGIMPIAAAAVLGAFAMLATRCLNTRQAARVVDGRIIMLIAAAIASSNALTATGGAETIAHGLLSLLAGAPPGVVMSALFMLIALTTNIMTNNAAAVLFTPIAIGIAASLGLPAEPFVVTVILAANASFATPVAYQTNLLVMGPGHYRYRDFMVAGGPLVLLLWGAFSIIGPWWYGL